MSICDLPQENVRVICVFFLLQGLQKRTVAKPSQLLPAPHKQKTRTRRFKPNSGNARCSGKASELQRKLNQRNRLSAKLEEYRARPGPARLFVIKKAADQADQTNQLKKQLEAKSQECANLKRQLEISQKTREADAEALRKQTRVSEDIITVS